MRSREQGVALISVLLIVVVAMVIGTQMISEQKLAVARALTTFNHQQVRQYALGGEELARQILREDFVQSPQIDFPGETWASPELFYEFENGNVAIRIEDLQGRINLNNLAVGQANNSVTRQRLLALMAQLGVEGMFADRAMDWVDSDSAKMPLGAEDYDYLGLERPYRTPGQPMADVSELRLLAEMHADAYSVLAPFVAALPDTNAPVNVNTASAEVLVAIAPQLPLEQAAGLVAVRNETEGWDSVQAFLQEPALAGMPGLSDVSLGVQSSFFQVSVRARFGERFAYLTSIVQRDPTDGSMRVIYRDFGKKVFMIAAEDENT